MSNWDLLQISGTNSSILVESTDMNEIIFFVGILKQTKTQVTSTKYSTMMVYPETPIESLEYYPERNKMMEYMKDLFWNLVIEARDRGWSPMHDSGWAPNHKYFSFIRTNG